MSTHKVDVVEVKLLPHSNANSLSVVMVHDFTVVVRTQDWHDGQLAAYVEPDMVVPADRPEFSFLAASHRQMVNNGVTGYRIKVKKLRGTMSMGLLIPAPEGLRVGDNAINSLGVVRYDPPITLSSGGEACQAPNVIHYKYDVESAYRYRHLFTPGEAVVATEKIHGASARYCYFGGEMYCGSRTEWKKFDEKNLWWKALTAHTEIQQFCEANPGTVVYGEVYGQVQDLKYGAGNGQAWFAAFDLLRAGEWLNHDESRSLGSILPWTPEIYRGPFDESLFAMADGESLVAAMHGAKQIREGVVIKPLIERTHPEIGRVQAKIVSNQYLERS